MLLQNRSLNWIALACLAAVPGALVLAQDDGQPMPLPPGWTMEDMQACMDAGTPGEMQHKLMQTVGTWTGTNEMTMAPGTPPVTTETTWTMSSFLDGRYVRCEVDGEVPGMGPFHGFGLAGYDNVAQQFVADWVDSMSTGIMRGTGELSADGKTFTWTYRYHCPITQRPAVMREVQTLTSDTTMSVEMHCTDPKSGTEYQCMKVELSKRS